MVADMVHKNDNKAQWIINKRISDAVTFEIEFNLIL